MPFKVKDINLSKKGFLDIEWASTHMPVLSLIKEDFESRRPLEGVRVGACLHITKETAVLLLAIKTAGAEVYACPSNPLSTQDHVAAALAESGINIFAWRNQTNDEYYWCINQVLSSNPMITMDDGADLTVQAHKKE
jgi:S-adenosylhomocysteine hydrolase